MKLSLPRLRVRRPTPRVWLGLALIAISIGGTTVVIARNSAGTGIVLATQFIPAGSVVGLDDVAIARISADVVISEMPVEAVVGQRVATNVAAGDIITTHTLDSTMAQRRILAVPLGITSAQSAVSGSRVELWFIPTSGEAPPRQIAHDAVLIDSRTGSFGEGDIVDVSIDSRDEDRVLAALGMDGLIVTTEGAGGS